MYSEEYLNKLETKILKLKEYGKTLGLDVVIQYDDEKEIKDLGRFRVFVSNFDKRDVDNYTINKL